MKLIIGIDPGAKGAISAVDAETGRLVKYKTFPTIDNKEPDLKATCDMLREFIQEPCQIWIEELHALGLVKASSNFKLGQHFGFLTGCIYGIGYDLMFVKPKTWQKKIWQINEFEWTNPGEKDSKAISLKAANRLFPEHDFLDKDCKRCRSAHDGIVDSALIAYYGFFNKN